MKTRFLLTAAAVMMGAGSSASAAVYDFTFSGGSYIGTGTFTTADTPMAGGFQILSTTGSVSIGGTSYGITGTTSFAGADNILYANSNPVFSFDGTSFATSLGLTLNLYYSSGFGSYRLFTSGSQFQTLDSFMLSAGGGAVPEPTSWILMIAGFGVVGGALRSKRRVTRLRYA